jgi:hypothetical protein
MPDFFVLNFHCLALAGVTLSLVVAQIVLVVGVFFFKP